MKSETYETFDLTDDGFQNMDNVRFVLHLVTLALRELGFCCGPLVLTLTNLLCLGTKQIFCNTECLCQKIHVLIQRVD